MKTSPRVSVVIPAYNHEAYIGAAIQSVLAQTFVDFELIIINDGSTDGTGLVIEQFADPRIRSFHQENRGLSATLNRGLSLARGEYFGFLPSDDLYEPEKLARQVTLLEAHPEVGLVFSHQTLIDAVGAPLQDDLMEKWFKVPYETKEEIFPALFERNFLAAPSVLMRAACFVRVGRFDESLKYAQDYDLWLRTMKYYDIKLLKQPLIRYRWHCGNLTYRATESTEAERAMVLLKAFRDLEIEDVFPSLRTSHPSEHPAGYVEAYAKLAASVERNGLRELLPVAKIYRTEAERWRLQKDGGLRPRVVTREVEDLAPAYRDIAGKITILMEVRSLDTGGLEEVVFNLSRSLNKDRFNVLIVCVERGGRVARKCLEHGIPVEVLGEHKEEEYRELLSRHNVNLICTHYSMFGGPLAAEKEIPLLSVVHNMYVWLPTDVFSEMKTNDRYISHYVAVSEFVRRYLIGRFNIQAEKVSVVQNGVDVEALVARERETPTYSRKDFGLAEEDYVFLNVAAITGTKGHNALIRAMKEVVQKYPRIKVLCVGDTLSEAYADIIKGRVKAWGLESNILFTDFVDRITDLYRLSDAFVLPSLTEGWSLAVGETMFFGLPIILTRVGSAETIIDDSDIGKLIEPSYGDAFTLKPEDSWTYCVEEEPTNVRQLIEAMTDFYERRGFWESAKKKRRAKIVTNHTLTSTSKQYENLFIRELFRFTQDREREYRLRLQFARALEQLRGKSSEAGTLVDVLWRRFDEMIMLERQNEQRLTAIDARLTAIDARLTAIDAHVQTQFAGVTEQLADLHSRQQVQLAALESRQAARLEALGQRIMERLSLTTRLKVRLRRNLGTLEELLVAILRRVRTQCAGVLQVINARLPFAIRHRMISLDRWVYPLGRLVTHRRIFSQQARTPLNREEAYRQRVDEIARLREKFNVNEVHLAALDRLLAESQYERIAIYPPTLIWGEHLFQRPQQIFRTLAKKGVLGFYCSASPSADGFDGFRKVADQLYLCSDITLLRGLDKRAVTMLWMTRPDHCWYRNLFPGALVVYEMIDELEVFPEYCEAMERDHLLALDQADVVVATARKLLERIKPIREDVVFAPNGVCLEDFQAGPTPSTPPSDIATIVRLGKPIIGYYGALAEWVDYGLVNFCAEACTEYSFVFIGPDYDGSVQRLRKRENVFWLGPKNYSELKHYLHYFDVATIPFQINAITESTSPIKLFEYMSGGKPVVTTALPECRQYRSVLIARDAEDYIRQLKDALEMRDDPDYLRLVQREAKENTWDARVEVILPAFPADAEVRCRYQIGSSFLRAIKRHNSPNIGHPMYEIWLDFALSTNLRGETAVEMVRRYTSISGKRTLDIGCAYGGFPIAFARAGAKAVGIDVSPTLLALAAENVKGITDSVSLHLKDITDWTQLGDMGTFGIVTCNDLIEHVENVPKSLEHIARLLKPGGLLYMQIPNAWAVRQVMKDGHYGLFGITLLLRPDAIRYFGESGYHADYGVGYFHRLDEYLDILAAQRIHLCGGEIANTFEDLPGRIDGIRTGLGSIRFGLSRSLEANGLSAATKRALADAVNRYLVQVSSDLEAYDALADGQLKTQRARSLAKSFQIEFWEVIGVKAT